MFIYSLFRSETQDVAEEKFIVYQEKIPLYITATKEVSVFFIYVYSTYILIVDIWVNLLTSLLIMFGTACYFELKQVNNLILIFPHSLLIKYK